MIGRRRRVSLVASADSRRCNTQEGRATPLGCPPLAPGISSPRPMISPTHRVRLPVAWSQSPAAARTPGAGRAVSTLARRQERELRDWLYGEPGAPPIRCARYWTPTPATSRPCTRYRSRSSSSAMPRWATHCVPWPVASARRSPRPCTQVRTGSTSTPRSRPIPHKCSSATVAVASTRLRSPDRLGIRQSIVGRLQRHRGGAAAITSAPGEGTEVRLEVPLADYPQPAAQEAP